ncbi:MoaD/ThiS family protein [Alkalibacter mobilis]|uniref:MoaD/ThiS family protein n=1 Tax=Alkalibacter mobilis TaxID=2787712 RepID=UPI00189C8EFD|nr:MoaD/ThiS family protein [Alkalibacter mobilis]MBF7095627.1 MoaD/ThiS family protein [Alkalibacter mobilis]
MISINFNGLNFMFNQSMTISNLISLMKINGFVENSSHLIKVNGKLITPFSIHQTTISDGDVITTKPLPVGG